MLCVISRTLPLPVMPQRDVKPIVVAKGPNCRRRGFVFPRLAAAKPFVIRTGNTQSKGTPPNVASTQWAVEVEEADHDTLPLRGKGKHVRTLRLAGKRSSISSWRRGTT